MKFKFRVEFPCGYRTESEGQTGLLEFGTLKMNTKDDLNTICPLHGKDCPPKPKK